MIGWSRRMLLAALALTCFYALAAHADAQSAGRPMHPHARSIDTADGVRRFSVWVPVGSGRDRDASASSKSPATPPALLVALHGNGADGSIMAAATGFHELAGREGFVAAYPDGLSGSWNYARGVPGYPEAPDDVSFVTAMVGAIEREFGTDPRRRYVVGYSNGGFMAQRLACDAADGFAGFVSVAAGGFAGLDMVCGDPAPGSVLLIHGTEDRNVPWGGLPAEVPGGTVYITWPVPESFGFWAGRAGCLGPVDRRDLPGDGPAGIRAIVVLELESCDRERRVALYGLVGAGHAWPRGGAFDATETAWAFLRAQTKP